MVVGKIILEVRHDLSGPVGWQRTKGVQQSPIGFNGFFNCLLLFFQETVK